MIPLIDNDAAYATTTAYPPNLDPRKKPSNAFKEPIRMKDAVFQRSSPVPRFATNAGVPIVLKNNPANSISESRTKLGSRWPIQTMEIVGRKTAEIVNATKLAAVMIR